jgi:DNA-binding CsgD family transcriptional regulator
MSLFVILPTPYQIAIPLRLDNSMAIGCAIGRRSRAFLDGEECLATVLQLVIAPLRLFLSCPDTTADITAPPRSLLTAREREVLVQLAAGSTAKAIARHLQVSPRTICKHLEHIYAKLGVTNRLSAVNQAHSLGLLPLPVRRTGTVTRQPNDRGATTPDPLAGPTGTTQIQHRIRRSPSSREPRPAEA